MSLQVYEQLEWHGMARHGTDRADPNTSWVEANTRPGANELQRMEARKPFMAELGAPAVAFLDPGAHYRLYKGDGSNPNFAYIGSAFKACVCFRTPVYKETFSGGYNFIFGAVKDLVSFSADLAWGLIYDPVNTRLQWDAGYGALDTLTSTAKAGSWYWLEIGHTGTVGSASLYEDGGATAIVTRGSSYSRFASTAAFAFMIGSDTAPYYNAAGIAVAYAACGSSVPSAWNAVMAEGGQTNPAICFMPTVAAHTVIPATINDPTNKYCWQLVPRQELEESVAITVPFKAKGIRGSAGKSYRIDLSDKTLLQDRTVLLFCYKADGPLTLFRSYDNQVKISSEYGFASSEACLTVTAPTNGASGGYGPYDNRCSAGTIVGSVHWLAAEFNPSIDGTAQSMCLYKWQSSAWAALAMNSTSNLGGFPPVDFSECVLLETHFKTAELYDFRLVVGDEGWQTTMVANATFLTIPQGLEVWVNTDQSGTYPRDNFASVAVVGECGDLFQHKIAIGDRLDGTYRCTIEPRSPFTGVTGCPYLKNAGFASIDDLWVDGNGSAIGMTDFYQFRGNVIRDVVKPIGKARRQFAPMGDSGYVAGAAPLCYIHRRAHLVGMPRVDLHHEDSSATTRDFRGSLSWATKYYFKATLYDPATGYESNPYGPFFMLTGTAPTSTTAPATGTPGCSATMTYRLRSSIDMRGMQVRIYRKHQGVGSYHYEQSVSLANFSVWSKEYYYTDFDIELSVSEDKLLQQLSPDINNNDPPLHSYCYLWGGRAWYVDAINPTRIWFSKIGRYGAVPGANLVLTDEGVGGNILGCMVGYGGLMLLRERSVWVIPQFTDDASAYAQPLISDIGCVSDASMVFAEGAVWWASPNGIYQWDGASQPISHSYRLKGLDRTIWSANPRATRAYYDRSNYRITFVCDGSGLCIDSRTGAACLVSAPESFGADAATSGYSGPVFGQGSGIFQEVVGVNGSLTLSTAQTFCSANLGPVATDTVSPVYKYWHDGTTARSGTAIAGWEIPGLNGTAHGWLTGTSQVGRALTMLDTDYEAIWSRPIAGVGVMSNGSPYVLVRHGSELLQEYCVDRIPAYYRSQDMYLGNMRDVRMYELMDLLTGDVGATATADIAFRAFAAGDTTEQLATARAVLAPNSDYQMPIRSRGNRCYYTYESAGPNTIASLRSIRLHFNQIRPRGQ